MNLESIPDLSKARSHVDQRPSGFDDWLKRIRESKSTDLTRSLLYYGFQPLFDALAEKRVEGRSLPLETLQEIVQFNTDFVSGYYTGGEMPDVCRLEGLEPAITKLIEAKVPYHTKTRNIGLYDGDGRDLCTPNHVQSFLVEVQRAVAKEILPPPSHIVGCACGSSEIVMAMSRIFETPLDFIRRSKRRGDDTPLVIREHVAQIRERSKDRIVYVVEDFVCTGRSIHAVMAKVSSYKPARVIGLSMARNMGDSLTSSLQIIHTFPGRHGSYAYEAKS